MAGRRRLLAILGALALLTTLGTVVGGIAVMMSK